MLKRMDGCTAARERAPIGTSWDRIATSFAWASGGRASAAAAARIGTSFGIHFLPPVKRLLLAVFFLLLVLPAGRILTGART